jgi:hypothetical protein
LGNRNEDIYKCECGKYEQRCMEWICDEDNPDCDCTETWQKEIDDDPANLVETSVPIGIRTVRADDGPWHMFSLCPGGNWVGTVR